jgi:hypothetical protein
MFWFVPFIFQRWNNTLKPKWVTKSLQSVTNFTPSILQQPKKLSFIEKYSSIKKWIQFQSLFGMIWFLKQYTHSFSSQRIVSESLCCRHSGALDSYVEHVSFAHCLIREYYTIQTKRKCLIKFCFSFPETKIPQVVLKWCIMQPLKRRTDKSNR